MRIDGHIEAWLVDTGDGGTTVIKQGDDGAPAMVYPDGNG